MLHLQASDSIQPLNKYKGQYGKFIKVFLLNDKRNKNGWRVSWEGIKNHAKKFIGFPGIEYEKCNENGCDIDHTDAATYEQNLEIQKPYAVTDTIDVVFDEENKTAYAIQRITNKEFARKIENQERLYVSPSIWPIQGEYEIFGRDEKGHVVIDAHGFKPIHLAYVNKPAYGEEARVTAQCDGAHGECHLQLLKASEELDAIDLEPLQEIPLMVKHAGTNVFVSVAKCVQDQIQAKIDDGHVQITDEELSAAYSQCGKEKKMCGCGMSALEEQIDMLDARIRLHAVQLQAETKDKGRWITTEKDQRIFIPEGADPKKTIKKAIDRRKQREKIPQSEIKRLWDLSKKEIQKQNREGGRLLTESEEEIIRNNVFADHGVRYDDFTRGPTEKKTPKKMEKNWSKANQRYLDDIIKNRENAKKEISKNTGKEKKRWEDAYQYYSDQVNDLLKHKNEVKTLPKQRTQPQKQEPKQFGQVRKAWEKIKQTYRKNSFSFNPNNGKVTDAFNQEHAKRFYNDHSKDGKPVYVVSVTNNQGDLNRRSESAYTRLLNEEKTPIIGKWESEKTGVQYTDISYPTSGISEKEARKILKHNAQESALVVMSDGTVDFLDAEEQLEAMADELDLLEAQIKLQALALRAATNDEKGRWITTEKKQRVFIPEGADVKETVEKAIKKRKKSTKSTTKKKETKPKKSEKTVTESKKLTKSKWWKEHGDELEKLDVDETLYLVKVTGKDAGKYRDGGKSQDYYMKDGDSVYTYTNNPPSDYDIEDLDVNIEYEAIHTPKLVREGQYVFSNNDLGLKDGEVKEVDVVNKGKLTKVKIKKLVESKDDYFAYETWTDRDDREVEWESLIEKRDEDKKALGSLYEKILEKIENGTEMWRLEKKYRFDEDEKKAIERMIRFEQLKGPKGGGDEYEEEFRDYIRFHQQELRDEIVQNR